MAPHFVPARFPLCPWSMISAIILANDRIDGPARADFTARCLGSLVEACVQGLVADAVLIGEAFMRALVQHGLARAFF